MTTTTSILSEPKKYESLVDELKNYFVAIEEPQKPFGLTAETLATLETLKVTIAKAVAIQGQYGYKPVLEVSTIGNVFIGEHQPDHYEVKLTATVTKKG